MLGVHCQHPERRDRYAQGNRAPGDHPISTTGISTATTCAFDKAGNASATGEVVCKPALRQEGAATVTKSSGWSTKTVSGSSGGSVLRSSKAGASIQTTFTGSAIGWVSTLGPTMGSADVYVDGTKVATVDLHRSALTARQIVWSKSYATPGTHTLQVRVLATSGHPNVDLDAFVVLGF